MWLGISQQRKVTCWFWRTAATRAAPLPLPSVDNIRSNLYSTPINWAMRDLIMLGKCGWNLQQVTNIPMNSRLTLERFRNIKKTHVTHPFYILASFAFLHISQQILDQVCSEGVQLMVRSIFKVFLNLSCI